MDTEEAPPGAIAEWLTRAHPAPEQVRKEWARQGVALLPLGERFAAVRMPSEIVDTAVRSEARGQSTVGLAELLGGPVIYDRRVAGGSYYALIRGHAGLVWTYEGVATCLGHGTYLGVPRLDRRQPPGPYWAVPPRYEGDLCAPRSVVALVEAGRAQLAEGAAVQRGDERVVNGTAQAPWAMRLVTDRLRISPPPYATVVLDGATQTALYADGSGRMVEMGKHGTSRTAGTASVSGGGDGKSPQPQTQDDVTTDYESD
ncbi:putative ATP-grasp-modified RiPP [Streptomyces sp. NPDC047706]|uniref:putative ATP-grasp-modified RiPP n=1 Tax=Streptomyces sp. NPDC047706 TaxID=3365486 RepID=UPI0037144EF7